MFSSFRKSHLSSRRSPRWHSLRIEPLERRAMLTAAAPGEMEFIGPLEADMVLSAPLTPQQSATGALKPALVDLAMVSEQPGLVDALPASIDSWYPVNTPPTTSGIADQVWNQNGSGPLVNVWLAFDDAEDGCWLTYDVTETGGSSIILYAEVNPYGELQIMPSAVGETYLTIRGTDSGGLYAETTFKVTVLPSNEPPEITNFTGYRGDEDSWTFSGNVSDYDSQLQGMIVQFGGVLASYGYTATVQSDGTFSLSVSFPGLQEGYATAQTHDEMGAPSNIASCYVYVV